MMKTGNILRLGIAVAVLGVVCGFLYWSGHHPVKPAPATALAAAPTIVNVNPASVTALTLAVKGSPPASLEKQSNGQWEITAPEKMAADSEQVSYLLETLSPLMAQEEVAASSPDLKEYGLEDPAISLEIHEKGHAAERLLIGDNTPVGNSAYAMLAGQGRVYTTAMDVKQQLSKGVTDLRDKRLLSESAAQMQRIELTRGGQTIVLAHDAGGWALKKPQPYRTDTFAAQSLADALSDAEMDSTQPSAQKADSAWANGTPLATVKVSGTQGTQTLEVRDYNGFDYAKSSIVGGVFQVDETLGDALKKTVDDFRNSQLFDFGDNEPDAIDVKMAGAKGSELKLTHNLQGWWMEGKKASSDKAEALVSGLRALRATKFASSGFGAPAMAVTVTSSKGEEKVEIAKQGSAYLARRAGDPSLYVLDGGAVEGVESAARQIRP